jgi:hypothetical protein
LEKAAPGGVDPLKANVYGGTPPMAANVTPNEEPAWMLLKAPVVISSGAGTIVIDTVPDPLLPLESVAVTPKEKAPGVVGVPCNCPLLAISMPGGKPPVAVNA